MLLAKGIKYCCYLFIGFEEGDGRCVRALLPNSAKRSILSLLLNPPWALSFIKAVVKWLF